MCWICRTSRIRRTGLDGTAAQVGSAGTCRNMTDPPDGLRTAYTAERQSPGLMYPPSSDTPKPPLTTGRIDSAARPGNWRRKNRDRQPDAATNDPPVSSYEHVRYLIESLPDDLTAEQLAGAEQFIKSRWKVIWRSEFDISRTDVLQHRIETYNNAPHFDVIQQLSCL